ncbi:MAG: hypothetical protein ABGX78_00590 [Microbacterium sp.]|uniref:hypothetical protein n=1 Tax=Microbacterium TaxID=33882 RepID=UPI000C4C6356|nr:MULTISPECIES: hypothetical protein [Microbacterium]MBU20051.1 hypothetical protein [Microbacterium sp.]MCC4267393.1 hypothetical protein [Microbacterium schleiferi]
MSINNPSDKTPMSRRGLLASALAAGTVGALAGSAAPAAAAAEDPRGPNEVWLKGSGLKVTSDEWQPLPEGYSWGPGRILYYSVVMEQQTEARRVWAVVLPDGTQRTFPESAYMSQLRMAFAERGWRWTTTNHPAASHVVVYLEPADFFAAGLGDAPPIR